MFTASIEASHWMDAYVIRVKAAKPPAKQDVKHARHVNVVAILVKLAVKHAKQPVKPGVLHVILHVLRAQ